MDKGTYHSGEHVQGDTLTSPEGGTCKAAISLEGAHEYDTLLPEKKITFKTASGSGPDWSRTIVADGVKIINLKEVRPHYYHYQERSSARLKHASGVEWSFSDDRWSHHSGIIVSSRTLNFTSSPVLCRMFHFFKVTSAMSIFP